METETPETLTAGDDHGNIPLIERIWSTPSLRSNILSYLPIKHLPQILTLSKDLYDCGIKKLYGTTMLEDYLTVEKTTTSYNHLRMIRHAVREIDLRGALPLINPFWGFTHLCDTFPRLTTIRSSTQYLYHIKDTNNPPKREWALVTVVQHTMGSDDTYVPPSMVEWTPPDNWVIVERCGLHIDQQVRPEQYQTPEPHESGKKSHWLTEIGAGVEDGKACIPACILDCGARNWFLDLAGDIEAEEMVKMLSAMKSERMEMPRTLWMQSDRGRGLGFLPALGDILGHTLTSLNIDVPLLTLREALQRGQWSSMPRLKHLQIAIYFDADSTDRLCDIPVDAGIPPLYLDTFEVHFRQPPGMGLDDFVSKLDTLLPTTHDLARAMYAIGGPTCNHTLKLFSLRGLDMSERDIPYYLRHSRQKADALLHVQAYYHFSMYEKMFDREIRRLEGAETVEKGWFSLGKAKVTVTEDKDPLTGSVEDVGPDSVAAGEATIDLESGRVEEGDDGEMIGEVQ